MVKMFASVLVAWMLAALQVGVLASSAADISSLDLSTVPSCGFNCIVGEVAASSCSLTDFDCICADAALAVKIETCLFAECSVRDALTTGGISKDMCHVPPQDRSLVVWLVPLVVVILSTIFYVLRVLSKFLVSHQGIDAADIILGICVGCTIPFLWAAFKLAEDGLGKDMWNIPQDNITAILNLYWWCELLYQAVLPLTRISILLFYLKIFPQRLMTYGNHALILINAAYLIAFEIATVFQCYPVQGAWLFWDGTFDGHCNDIHLQSWFSAAINIALDIGVIVLPLPALSKLSVSRRKKIQIFIMFCLGFFITIISIVRLQSLIVFANTTNVSYDYVEPGLYSIVECSTGIICGCLPAVRALLGKLWPKIFPVTENRSKFMGSERKSNPSRLNFSRLEETGNRSKTRSQQIKVKTEWYVSEENSIKNNNKKTTESSSESNVELVPMKIRPSQANVESDHDRTDGFDGFGGYHAK